MNPTMNTSEKSNNLNPLQELMFFTDAKGNNNNPDDGS